MEEKPALQYKWRPQVTKKMIICLSPHIPRVGSYTIRFTQNLVDATSTENKVSVRFLSKRFNWDKTDQRCPKVGAIQRLRILRYIDAPELELDFRVVDGPKDRIVFGAPFKKAAGGLKPDNKVLLMQRKKQTQAERQKDIIGAARAKERAARQQEEDDKKLELEFPTESGADNGSSQGDPSVQPAGQTANTAQGQSLGGRS